MTITLRLTLCLALWALPSGAEAFNALGHKVVADIAWQQLDADSRGSIVRVLRRHPRFDEDFAKRGDIGDDRWVFQQAATWPDLARGKRGFDKPTWHYINYPLFHGGERPVGFNLATQPHGSPGQWNIIQALAYCRSVIASVAPPSEKAVAYCWVFHLVGDAHQPLHSTALVSERFPKGDRGGNSIPLVQGENLHSLWDNLLGRQHKPNDVQREIVELRQRPEFWRVETKDAESWLQESHELCKVAYCRAILEAVEQPGELTKIRLPPEYLVAAGEHAQRRVVAAGLRLAAVLGAEPQAAPPPSEFEVFNDDRGEQSNEPVREASTNPEGSTHWLNLNGNIRHNASCRWYRNTARGRPCGPDEGRACGQCGG